MGNRIDGKRDAGKCSPHAGFSLITGEYIMFAIVGIGK